MLSPTAWIHYLVLLILPFMLGITVGTVHTHLKHIYGKLAVHSKTEAVFEAGRRGLLP